MIYRLTSHVKNQSKDRGNDSQRKKQRIQAPVQGQLVSLDQINDEVFASQQMGKTLAIYPTEEQIVSPGNGQVTALYPTHHAIGLKLDNGAEILPSHWNQYSRIKRAGI